MEQTEIGTSKFKNPPLRHQLDCLNRFGRREYYALLGEQGTGKTFITINDAADLWGSGDLDGLFVLAPNGVHENWTRIEIPFHMPDWVKFVSSTWFAGMGKRHKELFEKVYAAKNGELRILAMNYDALNTGEGFKQAERFCNSCSKLMIALDESSTIANPSSGWTKQVMRLKKYSSFRRIIDGTPIAEAPFDAFTQYGFLDETILQTSSYYAFKAEYAELLNEQHHLIKHIVKKKVALSPGERVRLSDTITALNSMISANGREELVEAMDVVVELSEAANYEKMASALEHLVSMFSPNQSVKKQKALMLVNSANEVISAYTRKLTAAMNPNRLPQIVDKDKEGKKKYKNLDKLSALIAPHSFRVLKKDCVDLPEKIYKTVFFHLTKEQQEIYNKAEKECRIVFEGTTTPFSKLVAVTKLAQITSGYYVHPLADEPVRINGGNPKLDLLEEQAVKVASAGDKLIVWARFRPEIEDICKRLRQAGLNVVEYHGGINKKGRTEAIDALQNGDAQVFVANKAAAKGLTLTAANHVIYFSNDYSARNRLQSEDRAHRIGQKQEVIYTNICAADTVDEQIVKALKDKHDLATFIVDRGIKLFS